jgi:hypothetical protein
MFFHDFIFLIACNGPASMWNLALCAGLKRLFMLAIVVARFYFKIIVISSKITNIDCNPMIFWLTIELV